MAGSLAGVGIQWFRIRIPGPAKRIYGTYETGGSIDKLIPIITGLRALEAEVNAEGALEETQARVHAAIAKTVKQDPYFMEYPAIVGFFGIHCEPMAPNALGPATILLSDIN